MGILVLNIEGGQSNGIHWVSSRAISCWGILLILHSNIFYHLKDELTTLQFSVSETGVHFETTVRTCSKIITVVHVSSL